MNLYPLDVKFEPTAYVEDEEAELQKFKGSYDFDFKTGEFRKAPDGKVLKTTPMNAYMQWCEKTLLTKRFMHSAYTDLYGQEYYTLIGSPLTKSAVELEVKRMTIEALMVHPYTDKVTDFVFRWEENESVLYFDYLVTTVFGEEYTAQAMAEVRA